MELCSGICRINSLRFLASQSRVEGQPESGRTDHKRLQTSALDTSVLHGTLFAYRLAMWRLFPLQVASTTQNLVEGKSLEVPGVSARFPQYRTPYLLGF